MVVFALYNGLVVLPVILSLAGDPGPKEPASTGEDEVDQEEEERGKDVEVVGKGQDEKRGQEKRKWALYSVLHIHSVHAKEMDLLWSRREKIEPKMCARWRNKKVYMYYTELEHSVNVQRRSY